MTTPSSIIKTDKIWYKDFSILFRPDRITEFFPAKMQTAAERMNALARFSLYSSILLVAYKRDYRHSIWTIVGFLITYLVFKNHFKENFTATEPPKQPLIKPTLNNPFMNVNLTDYTDHPDKQSAPTYFEDTKEAAAIKDEVIDKFNYNLYKSVDDVYEKNNNLRQFYTMPNTQIPNDQNKYLDFLYSDMKSNCKSDAKTCQPYSDLRANPPIFPNPDVNPTTTRAS